MRLVGYLKRNVLCLSVKCNQIKLYIHIYVMNVLVCLTGERKLKNGTFSAEVKNKWS